MSKPKEDWWTVAVRVVRNYPARKAEYEELHRACLSAPISGMPGTSDVSRATENIALRKMPPQKQRDYDAVTSAIEKTKLLRNGKKRLEFIARKYWKGKTLTIGQVVYQVGIGDATGRRWHRDFIKLVGEFLEYT